MLPRNFPKQHVMYSYFRHWSQKPSDWAGIKNGIRCLHQILG